MNKLRKILLTQDDTMDLAIKVLKNPYEIVLITDKNDALIGTVTDGDIRRALLKHFTNDKKLSFIMNKNPITCKQNTPKAKINDTFVQCEPNPEEKKDLIDNLKVLKKNFSYIKLEFVFDPISDGKFVSKQPTDFGHPVYSGKIKNNIENKNIKSIKIDDLIEKYGLSPSFIKIDVEGAEYEVLQGAKNTLKKLKL